MKCNNHCSPNRPDCRDNICTIDLRDKALQNHNYRETVWTGCFMQMTVMCIPACSDVGLEIHDNTDQIIRIELCFRQNLCAGECVCIPAGTWHNIINIGNNPLKLSSIYAPPHHPRGETQTTKARAMGMDC